MAKATRRLYSPSPPPPPTTYHLPPKMAFLKGATPSPPFRGSKAPTKAISFPPFATPNSPGHPRYSPLHPTKPFSHGGRHTPLVTPTPTTAPHALSPPKNRWTGLSESLGDKSQLPRFTQVHPRKYGVRYRNPYNPNNPNHPNNPNPREPYHHRRIRIPLPLIRGY